jgi:hypothetical protein
MGKMSRIMKISKWAVALTVIMVAVPEVLAAATYTSSSWFGSVKVEVIPPPAQPIPPKAYKPYGNTSTSPSPCRTLE